MKIIKADANNVFEFKAEDADKEVMFTSDETSNYAIVSDPICHDCALPPNGQYTCKWWGDEVRWLCEICSQPNWLFKPLNKEVN